MIRDIVILEQDSTAWADKEFDNVVRCCGHGMRQNFGTLGNCQICSYT